MKILYYDCFSGISGDMNLGAMVDLGVDKDYLLLELQKLHLPGYRINISPGQRKGITGTRVDVLVEDHHEHHVHRHLKDIRQIISDSELSESVKNRSLNIFLRIAEAEAKIHGKSIDEIHFHEVGAIDSIVDITGAAICFDFLKPDKIYSSTIEVGGGFVKCAHGTFPVPAPATTEILKNLPLKKGAVQFETTTPTGAAILAEYADKFIDNVHFTIQKTAYGIGYKDFDIPNVLRVHWAEVEETSDNTAEALMIECNIDDMNPEFYEYVFEQLFMSGAHDVFITPIIMKKSRPASKLSVLCGSQNEQKIIKILLKETSTLGIRKYKIEKSMLAREINMLETPYGNVRIKSAYLDGELLKSKPEYEDCLKIAKQHSMSLSEVYRIIEKSKNTIADGK
ncbi:MAG: nickel pincer cofactor biosynthesis protein LarC [Bacteroidales bacterium]|nr:nickel pincer cofactor biosynthesis protein LarC [Bacteroidales bacterium]